MSTPPKCRTKAQKAKDKEKRADIWMRAKRPRDPNQLAKQIVDEATGEREPEYEPEKNPAAVELGKLGGAKGGKARAEKRNSN